MRCLVSNPPSGYLDKLSPLPEGASLVASGSGVDFVQVFVKDAAEAGQLVPPAAKAVKPNGLLWVCYLKGGQKAGTDLNRDVLHAKLEAMGLTGVNLIAVDDAWSAMRCRV